MSAPVAGEVFQVRQRRFRPLLRWLAFAAAMAVAVGLYAWALKVGPPPDWPVRTAMIASGLALFVGALALVAGALTTVPHALLKRGRVVFRVHPKGIVIERKARASAPETMHRDEIAGPFVRVDEAIDEEASAATMMRMGGGDMALMLAEGARATGGSADTLTWFLFSGSAASVTVIWRGFTVVLAEALTRPEAEDLAHRVALRLDRLPR